MSAAHAKAVGKRLALLRRIRRIRRISLIGLISLIPAIGLSAAEPTFDPKELVRFPPVPPERALETFQVKPGFRLELVAAEPLVRDPVALSFDADGRLYVVEMIGYSERRNELLGQVRLLVDTDQDGRFDNATVFARGLPWPTAVCCYDGGVFVGATPDVFFFKDTDGDGVADVKELVLTGFADDYVPYDPSRLNMQGMLNNLTWGLDNRIHGATSFDGGHVRCVKAAHPRTLNLRGRDFSFDPRTWDLRAESGGGQHGMCFDDTGRKFICSNSDHLQMLMYEARYAANNPWVALPSPRISIAVDGPAATVYRISPDEPWRVIRTRWRVAGLVPGPIEGGGRPSGYFTSACGIMVYRGDAWPDDFHGDVFVADCGSNLIHRKKLRPDGVSLKGERPADEQHTEFIASRDTWFRPVQLANAPDGTLYVLDMYREIIEHPWSLPEPLKSHLDLNAGNDRGRIYRIVPEGYRQRPLPRLSRASTAQLVATLEHPNGWHRDTASRLLYERQDPAAVPLLRRLLAQSEFALARMHALYALEGLGALARDDLYAALADADGRVRRHAVRLCESHPAWVTNDLALQERLRQRVEDPDPLVRYQLAFTLGCFSFPDKARALARLAARDIDDRWMRAAVLSAAGDGMGELFARLAANERLAGHAGAQELLGRLAEGIGAQAKPDDVQRVLAALQAEARFDRALHLANTLADGLERRGRRLAAVIPRAQLGPWLERAARLAVDAAQPPPVRVEAVRLLGSGTLQDQGDTLRRLLGSAAPAAVQQAAVASLARFNEPAVATALLAAWERLTPRLRSEVVNALLKRRERVQALLDAVAAGRLSRVELGTTAIEFLLKHKDPAIRERAAKLLGAASAGRREDVVQRYQPALQMQGVATNGHRIFLERCQLCHRLGGEGFAVGPDLVAARNSGRAKMLVSILDPNRDVAANYLSYEIETKDDETVLGILVSETDTSVTLRQAYGIEKTVMRADIRSIRSQGLSLMPEELEVGLTLQDMADLLEYLNTAAQ